MYSLQTWVMVRPPGGRTSEAALLLLTHSEAPPSVKAGLLTLQGEPRRLRAPCWIDPASISFRNLDAPPSSGKALISWPPRESEYSHVELMHALTWRISQIAKTYSPPVRLAAFGVCAVTLVVVAS